MAHFYAIILPVNGSIPSYQKHQEQINDIVSGKKPNFDGKPIVEDSYSASKYPHLADKGDIIYPATYNEHLNGWHLEKQFSR